MPSFFVLTDVSSNTFEAYAAGEKTRVSELDFSPFPCYIVFTGDVPWGSLRRTIRTKGELMKRTLIAAAVAVAAGLAAMYLSGADGTATTQPGTHGTNAHPPTTAVQQVMQAPALETVECSEGYILLMPCPVCHTCPVCQANCGTAHALKCCLGNKKQSFDTSNSAAAGTPRKQHIMTNKAEAVKHAAGHSAAPQMQTDGAVMTVIEVESD